jgi:hypothetical protein
MAFINALTFDVFGPDPSVEEEPYLLGFVWTVTRRTNYQVRVTWPIDATGSESPPATWTVGADTYTLLSGATDRGYGRKTGHYTAIYRKEGTWTPVIP